jgi:hypothetical protein
MLFVGVENTNNCIYSCNPIYFLKFVVHKLNLEMVKSEMVKLTVREKTEVADADVVVSWIL